MLRGMTLLVGLLTAVPAIAGEMSAEEARHFVTGKLFSYTCFEGTRGQGRVHADGSVVGSIQIRGQGPLRYALLPPGTLKVKGESVCASLRGLPIEPCFNLERIDTNRFRGSISGLGFAYCEFTRNQGRAHMVRSTQNTQSGVAAAVARRRQSLNSSANSSPEKSCRSWWRGHKACPRDPSGRPPRSQPCGRDG